MTFALMLNDAEYEAAIQDVSNFNDAHTDNGATPFVALRAAPDLEFAMARATGQIFNFRIHCVTRENNYVGVTDGRAAFFSALEKEDSAYRPIWVAGHEMWHLLQMNFPEPCDLAQEKMWPHLIADAYELRRRIEDGDVEIELRRFFGEPPAERQFATPAVVQNEVLADVNGNMWMDSNFWRLLSAGDTCPNRLAAFEAISRHLASKQVSPYRNWIGDWPKARELMVGLWGNHLRLRCE